MDKTREIFAQAVRVVEDSGIGYGVFGGVAVWEYGERRPTNDIDFLMCPADADIALDALEEAGFTAERTDPKWLFKAEKDGVTADIIFEVAGGEVPCEAVLARIHRSTIEGISMNVIAPEDIILIKLAVIRSHRPWDWFDALAAVRSTGGNLDWDYLIDRSHSKPERLLSLLLFAKSSGYGDEVPGEVLRKLAGQASL